ncbi:MAG: Uma2 family endonuclease [Isosphaeraceae bacterium]
MATVAEPRPQDKAVQASLPPLENGDRLTRAEFERRYDAMPGVKKAELIEGVVYMPSPVRLRRHGEPHALTLGWLTAYRAGTPGVIAADNASARLDLDNEPQPDALLMIDPERGGQARISDNDYVEGAPELVLEVGSSTIGIDLNLKLHVYRRSGVREYVVWRVQDRKIDWFVLRDGEFILLDPDEKGHYRSTTFPGLWLDAPALVEGDMAKVLDVVRQGLAAPEHAKFVSDLAARSSSPRP